VVIPQEYMEKVFNTGGGVPRTITSNYVPNKKHVVYMECWRDNFEDIMMSLSSAGV
jgi:hypothetical protein